MPAGRPSRSHDANEPRAVRSYRCVGSIRWLAGFPFVCSGSYRREAINVVGKLRGPLDVPRPQRVSYVVESVRVV